MQKHADINKTLEYVFEILNALQMIWKWLFDVFYGMFSDVNVNCNYDLLFFMRLHLTTFVFNFVYFIFVHFALHTVGKYTIQDV